MFLWEFFRIFSPFEKALTCKNLTFLLAEALYLHEINQLEQTEEEEDTSNGSCSIGTQVLIPKTNKDIGTVICYKNQSTRKYSRSFGTQTNKCEGITKTTPTIDLVINQNKPELSNRATQTDNAGDRETIVRNFNFDDSFQSSSYYPEDGNSRLFF